MIAAKLELIPQGSNFILRRTTNAGTSEIILSEDDVLTLSQSAQSMQNHIVAKHTPSGETGQPVVAVPTPKFRLNYDPLHGDILLDLAQPNGLEHHFALPIATAKTLLENLPLAIASANAALAKTSQH